MHFGCSFVQTSRSDPVEAEQAVLQPPPFRSATSSWWIQKVLQINAYTWFEKNSIWIEQMRQMLTAFKRLSAKRQHFLFTLMAFSVFTYIF
jgi:hypothetical protein